MSVNGIKMGRIPKLVKFKAIQSIQLSNLNEIVANSVDYAKAHLEAKFKPEDPDSMSKETTESSI